MTYTIDLSPEEEAYLRKMAAERGQTPEEYAIELIMKALDKEDQAEGRAGSEREAGEGAQP